MRMSIFALGLAAVSMAFVWIGLLTDKPRTHVKCRQECGDRAVSVAQKDDGSENALPDYDPTNPSERAKADEKIVAFLREHTGHGFGDDFAAAGFSTNESTVTFPARKPFGIFDLVEVSQLVEEGRWMSEPITGTKRKYWSRRHTGKIQSFCLKTSQKNVVTNVTGMTLDKAGEMLKPIGMDLAKRVDLQEDYFDLKYWGYQEPLKKRLDRQKLVRKPYPNIKMDFPRDIKMDFPRVSIRRPSYVPDLTLTFDPYKKTKDFDLELRCFKSEDEVIIEWREEQRRFVEIDKCYSHGIFVDKSNEFAKTPNQYHAVDVRFMTAFKKMTGFGIGQGYVNGVAVTTNVSMDCEAQEVALPIKFCAAKKEQLLFKNGRLYGVSMQVPFCEASRKMENRPSRVVGAERDGVWNEMDAIFGVGPGWTADIRGGVAGGRYAPVGCGWKVAAVPTPERTSQNPEVTPERIDLLVAFDAYYRDLRDGAQGVIVDIERLRNLNDEEKVTYAHTRGQTEGRNDEEGRVRDLKSSFINMLNTNQLNQQWGEAVRTRRPRP